MPGGDKTGPMGAGPMTGWGAGFCAGYGIPGYRNRIPDRGSWFGVGGGPRFGRGFRGGGRGWRHVFYATGLPGWARSSWPSAFAPFYRAGAPYSEPEELADLKEQAANFNEMLDNVNKRIDELQKKQKG